MTKEKKSAKKFLIKSEKDLWERFYDHHEVIKIMEAYANQSKGVDETNQYIELLAILGTIGDYDKKIKLIIEYYNQSKVDVRKC